MGLDLGRLVSTIAPALGALTRPVAGGGDGGPQPANPAAPRGRGASEGALGGLGALIGSVDLVAVGKLVNPNLPPDQAAVLGQVGSFASSFMRGGPRNQVAGAADPTKAGQLPGTPDEQLARQNADRAIAQIDWSKPNIAIWVPGTGQRGVDPQFARTLGGDTSVVAADYPANLDFMGGVSTGMLTTKYILEAVAARGRTASLTGYSQGAWVAGEVMADPAAAKTVSRAALFGHPKAANAQYAAGHPKVRVVNNADDPYANMGGDTTAIRGLSTLASGNIDAESIAGLATAFVTQPDVVGFLATAHDPNVGRRHAYDLGSQAAWLKAR